VSAPEPIRYHMRRALEEMRLAGATATRAGRYAPTDIELAGVVYGRALAHYEWAEMHAREARELCHATS
jgi:hypothetical protein